MRSPFHCAGTSMMNAAWAWVPWVTVVGAPLITSGASGGLTMVYGGNGWSVGTESSGLPVAAFTGETPAMPSVSRSAAPRAPARNRERRCGLIRMGHILFRRASLLIDTGCSDRERTTSGQVDV